MTGPTRSNPKLTPYSRSKTIAEQAAWSLVRERGAEERLAVVNPVAILGPVLNDDLSYSLEIIERLLKGMPGVPRLGFSFVDVRDVADLEIRAMTAPEAAGERFLAAGPFLWMTQVAGILRDQLGPAAKKVPTRTVPNLLVRAMAIVDSGLEPWSASSARRSPTPPTRRRAGSAGRPDRSRTRSLRPPRA